MSDETTSIKSFFIGTAQVILFVIFYDIILIITHILAGLLLELISMIPLLGKINATLMHDGIFYTMCPLIISSLICFFMGIIFRRGLYLISEIIMFMYVSYSVIYNLINVAIESGVISWAFANAIWYSVILCVIIFKGLFSQLTAKFTQQTEDNLQSATNVPKVKKNFPTNQVGWIFTSIVIVILIILSVWGFKKSYLSQETASVASEENITYSTNNIEPSFYTTSRGEHYHTSECEFIKNQDFSKIMTITENEANKKGLTACTDCFPSKVYTLPLGEQYHTLDCEVIQNRGTQQLVTLEEKDVQALGLTPCPKCNP